MKKKISVFALLLFLMLSFFVPIPALAATETTADDVKYRDIEDFMHGMGYTDFDKTEGAVYFAGVKDGTDYFYVLEFLGFDDLYVAYVSSYNRIVLFNPYGLSSPVSLNVYQYYVPVKASLNDSYSCLNKTEGVWGGGIFTTHREYYNGYALMSYPGIDGNVDILLYSDVDIYMGVTTDNKYYKDYSQLLFSSSLYPDYSFPSWCIDAGLSIVSSSNESPSKIPYSYNDHWHIVRRTANGKWLLTTIGNSVMQENANDYMVYLGENGDLRVLNMYVGDDVKGYELNVRQYEYDTDGWKVRTYDIYDFRDLDPHDPSVSLGAGTGFDSERILAYTNVDIFDKYALPLYPKSTEYYEVTIIPPTEEPEEPDSPTPIPTTVPDNDSSGGGRPGSGSRPDTGGQATGGGGLDFIINLFTLIWTKICSIPMAVDGYSISLQQIVIYGALVSIVGGFIMHFIFGRK